MEDQKDAQRRCASGGPHSHKGSGKLVKYDRRNVAS